MLEFKSIFGEVDGVIGESAVGTCEFFAKFPQNPTACLFYFLTV